MREGWRETTLGEIATIVGGGTPSTSEPSFWGGEIVWLTPTEVVKLDGALALSSERTITPLGLDSSSARLLPPGTVLLTSRASVGFTAIAGREVTTNQGFQSLICGSDVLPDFLRLWIQGNRSEFTRRASGSTFPEISKAKVAGISIALPPLNVQRRVVDLISSVDQVLSALLAEWHEATRNLRVARAVLLSTIDAGLAVPLGDVAECSWGNTTLTKSSYAASGDIAYSASGPDGLVASGEMNGPAVILSAIGARCGGTWLADGRWTAIKNTIWFRGIGGRSTTEFLYWATLGLDFFPKRGQAQPFISLGDVRAREILLPSLAEQRSVSVQLNSLQSLAQCLERERKSLQELRGRILARLLSGAARIPDSYDALLGEVA